MCSNICGYSRKWKKGQRRRKQIGNKEILRGSHQNDVASGNACMQGARLVQTVPLYLKNVKVNGDENDNKIGAMVDEYAKSR